MTEDWKAGIEALTSVIYILEQRIVQLEYEISKRRLVMDDDSWYWDH